MEYTYQKETISLYCTTKIKISKHFVLFLKNGQEMNRSMHIQDHEHGFLSIAACDCLVSKFPISTCAFSEQKSFFQPVCSCLYLLTGQNSGSERTCNGSQRYKPTEKFIRRRNIQLCSRTAKRCGGPIVMPFLWTK